MRSLICLFLVAISPSLGYTQVRLDSSYTYKQLNEMLSNARKGDPSNHQKDLAHIYYLLGNYEDQNLHNSGQAFEYYTRSKEYFDILGDSLMSHQLELQIAKRYVSAGMYQESIDLYNNALRYYKNQNDLSRVTHIQYDLSKVYTEKGDPETGLQYLNRAILLNEEVKDSALLVSFLLDKIKVYQSLNELDSALILSFEAFKISDNINDPLRLSLSLYHIGRINKIKSEYDKAIKYLLRSEAYAPEHPYSELKKKIYILLGQCYAIQKDYENAYIYNQKYADLNNKILNRERTETINNLTIKYQSEEKNTQMKILEIDKASAEEKNIQQRRALYLLAAGLLLLLALLYYIINFYRQKIYADEIIGQQKEEINQRKIQELKDNIQISSMKSMLEGQEMERERIAKDLHDSLGGLLSTIKLQFDSVRSKMRPVGSMKEYKSANTMLDSAVAEVRSISQNLQPGALTKLGLIPALKDLFNRYDDEMYPDIDFQYYEVPEKLDTMVALSIYRIIQELLYNTIKHANASEILIQINKEDDELVIQYEDDGKGFDINKLKHRGMGLDNVMSRVNYLKGQINFDSKEGEGMSVLIHHVKYE